MTYTKLLVIGDSHAPERATAHLASSAHKIEAGTSYRAPSTMDGTAMLVSTSRAFARIALGLTASALMAASAALPASAAGTTATVVIEAGALSITAPGSFYLGNVFPGRITQGTMSGISVSDGRAGVLGWTATVSVSEFTGTADPLHKIDTSEVTYTAAAAVKTGTSTVVAAAPVTAPTSSIVQTASGVIGNNTAKWDASIAVDAPSDAHADDYTATVVHSVI